MAEPYVDYLGSIFFYCAENVRAAEKATAEGDYPATTQRIAQMALRAAS